MLMTGVDNHLNGLGTMVEGMAENQKGMPGYEGFLNDNVVTIPQLLLDNGYHTYMTGKWHLAYGSMDPTGNWEELSKNDPYNRGFEETFSVELPGSHFANVGVGPGHVPIATKNGQIVEYPQQYIDDVFTDYMIEFIDKNHEDGKPMFMYLAFWNNHWPIQAPQEYLEKYEGVYDEGWDKIREKRFERQKELGLIPNDVTLSPRHNAVPAWDSLNATQQKQEAKKMEIFAAMLDSIDNNVGRVVVHLKETGEYDNTMIFVFADNGAEANDPSKKVTHNPGLTEQDYQNWLNAHFNNDFENWGNGDSQVGIGLGWAQVGNTPLFREKMYQTEGGTRVPMIVKFTEDIRESSSDAFTRVSDISLTILDYAQIQNPGTTYGDKTIHAMDGKSLRPILESTAQEIYGDDEPVGAELFGNSALYKGDWKASRHISPLGDGEWKLYHLTNDLGEQNDLSEQFPDVLSELIKDYDDYAQRVGVIPPIGLELQKH
jgi:arylsulfatase